MSNLPTCDTCYGFFVLLRQTIFLRIMLGLSEAVVLVPNDQQPKLLNLIVVHAQVSFQVHRDSPLTLQLRQIFLHEGSVALSTQFISKFLSCL